MFDIPPPSHASLLFFLFLAGLIAIRECLLALLRQPSGPSASEDVRIVCQRASKWLEHQFTSLNLSKTTAPCLHVAVGRSSSFLKRVAEYS